MALLFLISIQALGQEHVVTGKIIDQHSGEPVPFASLRFQKTGIGISADSAGGFLFRFQYWPEDSLLITSVGYRDLSIYIGSRQALKDTISLTVHLPPGKFTEAVIITKKVNRGLQMWRRIVKRKPYNDRYRFDNFSYELYNKLELDLKHVNKDKLMHSRLLKPLNFIFENIDTVDGVAIFPSYLTEVLSEYYYQKDPLKRREEFKGVKTIGIKNESISKLLGGMDQVVNFYNNFIPVFDKQFISPISDNGDNYYNYKVADTQYVGGRRFIHFLFSPKHIGQNTFEGDCWVHDSTFAIQKMNLRLGKDANVNFVDRLSLIQEYQLVNDSIWFLSKDKFVVDVNPIGKNSLSFIGRKTTTYRKIMVNDSSVIRVLSQNKKLEETILPESVSDQPESFWGAARHEELSVTEKKLYKMIDTLVRSPTFQRYTRIVNFIGTGYLRTGKFILGPWQNWIYTNSVEGLRLRFDLGTSSLFSQKVILHGYGAYGFKDERWKGELDVFYLIGKKPRMYLYGEYINDFDYGQNYLGEISQGNIFALAARKNGVPIKYLQLRQEKLEWFKEWNSGFSFLLASQRRQYTPIRTLPGKAFFSTDEGRPLSSFETSIRLRFAYLEKFLENTFYRTSLGSPYPITELKYTKGFRGVLNTAYKYDKLSLSISNFRRIPPIGTLYWNLFGGKTFGTLPYLFLDVAPGNEIYYYNKFAYNLMNRFEFIHDRYAGFNLEHNIGNGLFRYIPLTRKLKFRQFWNAKGLIGSLSEKNRAYNSVPDFQFESLNGKTYLEVGTGVDNIFKIFRVDFIWRLLPEKPVVNKQRFGVFGSLRFSF